MMKLSHEGFTSEDYRLRYRVEASADESGSTICNGPSVRCVASTQAEAARVLRAMRSGDPHPGRFALIDTGRA